MIESQDTAKMIEDLVEHFREVRKKRTLDFTLFQFEEFATEHKIPEALKTEIIAMIKDPTRKFKVKFKAD